MTRADSAGVPWEGRSFQHHDTSFARDEGSMPEAFRAAMLALRADGDDAPDTGALARVVDALREARLLVPLLAEAGETGVADSGRIVDKTQELSIVSVAGPDGAPVLPMFSAVDAMRAWRADARPVPVEIGRAAAAAIDDGAGRIVVDPGSPTEIVLTTPMLRALVTGEPWRPAIADEAVHGRLVAAASHIPGLMATAIVPRDPQSRLAGVDLELVVFVRRDARERADAALQAMLRALAADELVTTRVASLGLRRMWVEPGTGIDARLPRGSRVWHASA